MITNPFVTYKDIPFTPELSYNISNTVRILLPQKKIKSQNMRRHIYQRTTIVPPENEISKNGRLRSAHRGAGGT